MIHRLLMPITGLFSTRRTKEEDVQPSRPIRFPMLHKVGRRRANERRASPVSYRWPLPSYYSADRVRSRFHPPVLINPIKSREIASLISERRTRSPLNVFSLVTGENEQVRRGQADATTWSWTIITGLGQENTFSKDFFQGKCCVILFLLFRLHSKRRIHKDRTAKSTSGPSSDEVPGADRTDRLLVLTAV